jgi:hypothetical protein
MTESATVERRASRARIAAALGRSARSRLSFSR